MKKCLHVKSCEVSMIKNYFEDSYTSFSLILGINKWIQTKFINNSSYMDVKKEGILNSQNGKYHRIVQPRSTNISIQYKSST